jgi:hypothetical protein
MTISLCMDLPTGCGTGVVSRWWLCDVPFSVAEATTGEVPAPVAMLFAGGEWATSMAANFLLRTFTVIWSLRFNSALMALMVKH